jgi:hypothetical protein
MKNELRVVSIIDADGNKDKLYVSQEVKVAPSFNGSVAPPNVITRYFNERGDEAFVQLGTEFVFLNGRFWKEDDGKPFKQEN